MTIDKKRIKPLILFVLIILVAIAAGYRITKLQKKDNDALNNSQTASSETKEQENKQQKALKKVDYVFSSSSQGSLIQKQSIVVEYHQNDEASALISNKFLDKIRINQNVILYDKAKTTMPLGGKIKSITPHDDELEIVITLPKGTKTEYLSNETDIITLEARSSLRFPLSALQKDKNGNHYAWSVEGTEKKGKFKTNKIWIDTPLIGENHFVSGHPIGIKTPLVLNPDRKIKHQKIYKMVEVEYKASPYNPIKQAYYDYQIQKRQRDSRAAKKSLADCRANALKNKASTAVTAPSNSCGGSAPNGKTDPMDIFNSILSRQPGSTQSSGSCNASCKTPSP